MAFFLVTVASKYALRFQVKNVFISRIRIEERLEVIREAKKKERGAPISLGRWTTTTQTAP